MPVIIINSHKIKCNEVICQICQIAIIIIDLQLKLGLCFFFNIYTDLEHLVSYKNAIIEYKKCQNFLIAW